MITKRKLHRFTSEEYQGLISAGIVQPSPHTELRNGQIIQFHFNLYRFTIEQYHRMREIGIYLPEQRTELLDGQPYKKSPIDPGYSASVTRVSDVFNSLCGKAAIVNIQNPIVLSGYTELVPDVSVLRPHEDGYGSAQPKPADVLLLVEVVDSLLPSVLEIKAKLYAKAGIPELWVADLQGDRLFSYRAPMDSGYADEREHTSGQIAALAFHDIDLKIDDLLGRSISESIRRSDPKGPRKR